MISDPLENILQISLRIDPAKLGSANERIHTCSTFTAAVGAQEKKVLSRMESFSFTLVWKAKGYGRLLPRVTIPWLIPADLGGHGPSFAFHNFRAFSPES
jgi:hypothetical protein